MGWSEDGDEVGAAWEQRKKGAKHPCMHACAVNMIWRFEVTISSWKRRKKAFSMAETVEMYLPGKKDRN